MLLDWTIVTLMLCVWIYLEVSLVCVMKASLETDVYVTVGFSSRCSVVVML